MGRGEEGRARFSSAQHSTAHKPKLVRERRFVSLQFLAHTNEFPFHSIRCDSIRFVSFCFVLFRFVSLRSVPFLFLWLRFRDCMHACMQLLIPAPVALLSNLRTAFYGNGIMAMAVQVARHGAVSTDAGLTGATGWSQAIQDACP